MLREFEPSPNPPDPDHAPIFIIGTGRSGTSLLRAMLNAHPRIHLASFYPWTEMPLPWVGGTRRLELYYASFSFAWLGIDPRELRAAFPAPVPRERFPDVLRAILRRVAARHGKPRWGEKNPLNSLHLDRIFAAFPDARVVRTVRDPRGTLDSYARMPFSCSSALFMRLTFRRGRRRLAPYLDRILTIRMEDLLADPRSKMAEVLAYVGEPWDEAVLDHAHHLPPDDGPPFPWVVDAYAPLDPRPPSWPRRLSPARIRLVERLNRRWMRLHGYEPTELVEEPTTWALAREAAVDAVVGARYMWRGGRYLRRLTGRRPLAAAEAQRRFLELNPDPGARFLAGALPDPPALPD